MRSIYTVELDSGDTIRKPGRGLLNVPKRDPQPEHLSKETRSTHCIVGLAEVEECGHGAFPRL